MILLHGLKWSLLLLVNVIDFVDSSQTVGVSASHDISALNPTYGIGQAFIDIDNDDDMDLLMTNQEDSNYVFINQGSGSFLQSAAFPELNLNAEIARGVTVADYDNDGWDDILYAIDGQNRLFKNNMGTSFVDVSNAAGLSITRNSVNAAWADINADGFLDFYVINYQDQSGPLAKDEFYLNNGDGTFTEISDDLQLAELSKPGLAITFFDYDNDGDQDIYVVNDKLVGNTLWANIGPATQGCGVSWCFQDVSVPAAANRAVYGMGIAIGDYDLDGDYDMYFSSIAEQVLLQSQVAQGSDTFIDQSNAVGLNFDAVGWATLFLDLDNDGWLDAYLATDGNNLQSSDRLYHNNGLGVFVDITTGSGVSNLDRTRGAASGDFNHDGLIDILTGNWGVDFKLYENQSTGTNNWIKFKLNGSGSVNRNAIGTKLKLFLDDNRVLMQSVYSGASFGAGNERTLHFGIGQANIERVEVTWPNQISHAVDGHLINQVNQLTYQDDIFNNSFESSNQR
ncbi:CRTAC1 family protein [Marinicella litoralis]|uniref:VCBS repeat protein n=1 Tax=Marinicella litoralis TaxID=644220 RepID=A0A4R6Y2F4_9GAMM|nr:CRTAC1 family protein [Marinicella litoralis]TDR23158.1 VCBS repeat protein [Marinicella litoralis]